MLHNPRPPVQAGARDARVALLLTDAHVRDGRVLAAVNDIMATGEVPGICNQASGTVGCDWDAAAGTPRDVTPPYRHRPTLPTPA